MKDVWQQILEVAEAGQAPRVTLSPAQRVTRRRRPGRPGKPFRWNDYQGYDPATGKRPRCKAPRCSRPLRKDQPIGCCAAHERAAIALARFILALASTI